MNLVEVDHRLCVKALQQVMRPTFEFILRQEQRVAVLVALNALLEAKGLLLKRGTVVDATIIAAPSSTKNRAGKRDPQMHQTKKGNQWHFGMKAHIGTDAESGLVHTVVGTAANVHDVTQAHALLHGEETCGFGDAGYRGAEKREEVKALHPAVQWFVAMQPGKRKTLNTSDPHDAITEQIEKIKAGVRAKVEHPFRVIKRQFGYVKTPPAQTLSATPFIMENLLHVQNLYSLDA